MSKSYTLPKAVVNALEDMILSPQKIGWAEVEHGPCVNAYQDLRGRTRLDIVGAGLFYAELTVGQAKQVATLLFS